MAFYQGLKDLRAINWGASYLWDIKIEGAPAPFNKFFPATEITEPYCVLKSFDFDGYLSRYSVPQSSDQRVIKVNFIDDSFDTLLNFFRRWINKEILNDGTAVSPLEKCTKMVTILKLDYQRQIVDNNVYHVYPDGELSYEGKSESGNKSYSVSLRIVG